MKNALLLLTALLVANVSHAAPSRPTTLPAKKAVKKKRLKSAKRIRRASEITEVDAPAGVTKTLPTLGARERVTQSFQRATTPSQGGVVMRSMSQSEYAEYAAAADREAEAAERVQRKKIAPPLPVEKLVIDDLEKQILAEVNETPLVPEPKKMEAPIAVAPKPPLPPIEEIPVPDDSILIGAYDAQAAAVQSTQPGPLSVREEIESELGLDPVETEALESLE